MLFVYMNGVHVGNLIRDSAGNYAFQYEKSWLERKDTRPISLSIPLTEAVVKGEKVYNFFNNLLPDSELIRNRIQARFKTPTNRCFDLLSQIGKDCIGALQLLTKPLSIDIKNIQAKPKKESDIAQCLKQYKTAPLGMSQDSDFRISLAGAQEKTALLKYKKKWCEPLNTTPTSHIIKLPIGYIEHSNIDLSDSIENEYLCLQILSAFGLPVNKAIIKNFKDVKTLVLKRFDRHWSQDKTWLIRLPQEDMCQALGISPGLKYESDGGPGIKNIMKLLQGAQFPNKNRKQFMKSIFLFWILGAIDGHAKNFSIFIKPGGVYELTPLYDVISAYPIIQKHQIRWKDMSMAMALTGKNHHYNWGYIQRRHWLSTAKQCHFPENYMQNIIDEICDSLENVIDRVASALPTNFPNSTAEPIFSGMRKAKKKITIK